VRSTVLGVFDFMFSSPPYFDFEKYSEDPGQSIVKFPVYEKWLEGYWRATIKNAYTMLDADGHFGVCLSPYCRQGILETTTAIAKEEGFFFEKDYKCPFKHVFGGPNKYEVVLIFSKARTTEDRLPVFNLSYSSDPVEKQDFVKDLKKFRKVYTDEEFEIGRAAFIESSRNKGVSRNTYLKNGVSGIPVHVYEHRYKSWNNFIRACGLDIGYESKSPVERIKEYFCACSDKGRALSFYEYEKETGFPSTRLKRLFNKGRAFSHLKQSLFDCAVDLEKQAMFLDTIKKLV
jgi:hypothetical protein